MPRRSEAELEEKKFRDESAFRTFVMKRVKHYRQQGKPIYAVKINDRTTAGISDILVCIKGRFVAVELKQPDKKASALQIYFIDCIRTAGGIGGVCYNWGDVKRLFINAGLDTRTE